MRNSFDAPVESLTPESVLDIIKDFHRQQCFHDPEAEPDIHLSFESTIEEWRQACDWLDCKPLGRALNERFGVNFSDNEWHDALEPSNQKTLLGVCELIATQGERFAIKPLNIFGGSCREAGVYIALRSALNKAGVPMEKVKPSSRLEPLLINHWGVISDEVGKIAPGVLPSVEIKGSFFQRLGIGLLFAGPLLAFLDWIWGPTGITLFAIAFGGCGALLLAVSSGMKPKSVSFENLETFGDLCSRVSESTLRNESG